MGDWGYTSTYSVTPFPTGRGPPCTKWRAKDHNKFWGKIWGVVRTKRVGDLLLEKLNCTDFCCGHSSMWSRTTLPETKIDLENGWKWMVGSLVSFWECIISEAVSVLGSVNDILQSICFFGTNGCFSNYMILCQICVRPLSPFGYSGILG